MRDPEPMRSTPLAQRAVWALQAGLAAVFLYFGLAKFSPHNQLWIGMFEAIGIGQWFRYFTGTLETLCAVALLIPRFVLSAAALLVCTMIAAIVIRLAILQHAISEIAAPVSCLAALLVVMGTKWQGRSIT